MTSYEAQKTYYTDKIMGNPQWSMAGIFADEGITGTSAEKRPEFLRMIRLCGSGRSTSSSASPSPGSPATRWTASTTSAP